jgi:bifunctional non-homologous end joining protein LigD
MKSTDLYFKEGGSDKEYHAKIEAKGKGYVVNFAYGRRGNALMTGTKTQKPVTLEEAEEIFDKLVREKMSKGYTESDDGKAFAMTDKAGKVSGLLPQLLNPVDEDECKKLLADDNYGAQKKFDGKRIMVRKKGETIDGSNRKGLVVSLPQEVVDELSNWPDCEIDGELVGSTYNVFDILSKNGKDLRKKGYYERYKQLPAPSQGTYVKVAELAVTKTAKNLLHRTLFKQDQEGIVFKKLDAPYNAGRPNSGGNQLKFKFYATCSAIVGSINKQRSVGLLMEGKPIGNVTIHPNKEVPKVGNVVEIKYLYAYEGGSLYQPQYIEVRDDIDEGDCKMSQLKYKKGEEENGS